MMTCTHGATVGITRMKRGESFSLTHMMHLKATEMGVRFFCSDVVCKYSKWAVKVAARFPEYKPLLGVKWFLSRFHGLVHSFRCRVMLCLRELTYLRFLYIYLYLSRYCSMDIGTKVLAISSVKKESKPFRFTHVSPIVLNILLVLVRVNNV